MSGERKDGGAAFPTPPNIDNGTLRTYGESGMSLRDYFAAQALAKMVVDHGDTCDGYRKALAERAYKVADALLAERARTTGER